MSPKGMEGKGSAALCEVTDMPWSGAVCCCSRETPSSALAAMAQLGHCALAFGSPGPSPRVHPCVGHVWVMCGSELALW